MQFYNDMNASGAEEIAITSRPSSGSEEKSGLVDWEKADLQHYNFSLAVEKCGVELISTTSRETSADAYMINRAAVITDSFAIIGNFAEDDILQRQKKNVASTLASIRFLQFISAPGLMDANDVLRAGNQFFIALSDSTNEEGAAQLAFFLTEAGYEVSIITDFNNRQPLSSLAVYLGDNKILIDKKLAKNINFIGFDQIIVSASERGATNSAMINGTLVMGSGFDNTAAELRAKGIRLIEVNISELERADIGVKDLVLSIPKMKKLADIETSNVTTLQRKRA